MIFYVNKHKIKYCFSEKGRQEDAIPEGTAFRIEAINGNMLEMKPIKNIGEATVIIDPNMLKLCFYEIDNIE